MSPAGGEIPRGRAAAADGMLLVDKPQGLTSHGVVARVRRMAATRKVGHAGTLDPMATGLLVLGVGRATRLLTYVVGADKTYEATIRLGVTTTTDDAEGEPVAAGGASLADVPRTEIEDVIRALTGVIAQVPSAVSAIKVDGQRAYARVRAGEDVQLAAREVTVHELTVLAGPTDVVVPGDEPGTGTAVVDVDVRVRCSSGTYVRAIARDLGAALGLGGHLTALRRTAVGPFGVDEGATIEAMSAQVDDVTGDGVLATVPAGNLARRLFPVRELTAEDTRAVRYGQWIDAASGTGGTEPGPNVTADDVVGAYGPDGRLVALLAEEGARMRPVLVLNPA